MATELRQRQVLSPLEHAQQPTHEIHGLRESLPLAELIRLKQEQGLHIAVVIPTLNEGATIGNILDTWKPLVGELVDSISIIDSGSTDDTASEVQTRGFNFHDSSEALTTLNMPEVKGKGTNVWLSQELTDADILAVVDGDMQNPSIEALQSLVSPLIAEPDLMLSKSILHRDTTVASGDTATGGRVTQLTVKPLMGMLFPELNGIVQPLNGNVAVRRSALETVAISPDYKVDLQVLIGIALQYGIESIAQVYCGTFKQEGRELNQLAHDANQFTRLLLDMAEEAERVNFRGEKPGSYAQFRVNGHIQLEERQYNTETLPAVITDPEYRERFATHVQMVRHARTQWNLDARIQGNVDLDIVQDPEHIAAYFDTTDAHEIAKPDVIVVSGLKRTEQTARALMAYNGWEGDIPIVTHTAFNERKWGILEGLTRDEARKLYPDIDECIDKRTFKAEGGESLDEVEERIQTGLVDIRRIYPGKNVLVVSHAGVMLSLGENPNQVANMTVTRNEQGQYILEH